MIELIRQIFEPQVQLVAGVLGVGLSIALETIPGLKQKWSDWEWKSLSILLGSVVISEAAYLLFPELYPEVQDIWYGVLQALGVGVAVWWYASGTYAVATRRLPNARDRR